MLLEGKRPPVVHADHLERPVASQQPLIRRRDHGVGREHHVAVDRGERARRASLHARRDWDGRRRLTAAPRDGRRPMTAAPYDGRRRLTAAPQDGRRPLTPAPWTTLPPAARQPPQRQPCPARKPTRAPSDPRAL